MDCYHDNKKTNKQKIRSCMFALLLRGLLMGPLLSLLYKLVNQHLLAAIILNLVHLTAYI